MGLPKQRGWPSERPACSLHKPCGHITSRDVPDPSCRQQNSHETVAFLHTTAPDIVHRHNLVPSFRGDIVGRLQILVSAQTQLWPDGSVAAGPGSKPSLGMAAVPKSPLHAFQTLFHADPQSLRALRLACSGPLMSRLRPCSVVTEDCVCPFPRHYCDASAARRARCSGSQQAMVIPTARRLGSTANKPGCLGLASTKGLVRRVSILRTPQ